MRPAASPSFAGKYSGANMQAEPGPTALTDAHSPSTRPMTPGRWTSFDRWWFLFFAVVALVALLVLLVPEPYRRIFVFLQDGVVVTLELTLLSFFCILIVGMLGGLARVSSSRILSGIASLYVEVVRGIPVLVWLLWIYFALPQVMERSGAAVGSLAPNLGAVISNTKLSPFTSAIIGFTFAYGAYMTEIFRAGIQSIAKGQMEAARSLGMNYIQAMRYVILPQAVRVILPPVGNEFVTLLKDSSLISIMAVSDLTRRGREFVARTFLSFDTFTMVALIYLILTLFFTRISTAVERQLAVEKRQAESK
jgi:polar amino acid transport system permease protein